jgi:hypothetical protein
MGFCGEKVETEVRRSGAIMYGVEKWPFSHPDFLCLVIELECHCR